MRGRGIMKRWLHHLQPLREPRCRHSDETREAAFGKHQSLLSADCMDSVCGGACVFIAEGFINNPEWFTLRPVATGLIDVLFLHTSTAERICWLLSPSVRRRAKAIRRFQNVWLRHAGDCREVSVLITSVTSKHSRAGEEQTDAARGAGGITDMWCRMWRIDISFWLFMRVVMVKQTGEYQCSS